LDFITRTHHVYYVSVDDYFDDDTSYEIPSQFQLLKDVFIALQKNEMTKQDKFLFGILEKSFILPTSKTYFNNSMEKFINVDPKMDINDLNEWNSMKNN